MAIWKRSGECLAADAALATRPTGEPGPGAYRRRRRADLVKRDWGAKGWEPLLYLCFTRLPLPAVTDNAVAIARRSCWTTARTRTRTSWLATAGTRHWSARSAKAKKDGRRTSDGTNWSPRCSSAAPSPYDQQVVYNIHFNGKVLWFLETIYQHSLRLGRASGLGRSGVAHARHGRLRHPAPAGTWTLRSSTTTSTLAEWCLTHGANPNAAPGPQRRNRQRSLYEEALVRGHVELAELLVRYGAVRSTLALGPMHALVSACLREDVTAIRAEIARHPEFLHAPEPLFAAAKYNRRRSAELLLDLGTPPDIESREGEHALHIAAYNDSVDVAELLIARGAEVDPIGRQYDNTPLGGAMHCQSHRMIDLLGRVSRSAWEVAYAGKVERLRELLAEKPERARATGDGETLLMWLPPGDESTGMAVAELLLAHGADPTIRDPKGMTAADRAERNAMFEVAAMLRRQETQP